jgi:hypothetical protein
MVRPATCAEKVIGSDPEKLISVAPPAATFIVVPAPPATVALALPALPCAATPLAFQRPTTHCGGAPPAAPVALDAGPLVGPPAAPPEPVPSLPQAVAARSSPAVRTTVRVRIVLSVRP